MSDLIDHLRALTADTPYVAYEETVRHVLLEAAERLVAIEHRLALSNKCLMEMQAAANRLAEREKKLMALYDVASKYQHDCLYPFEGRCALCEAVSDVEAML